MTEPPAKERRPWPMTWVAVAIAFYVVVYTFVNLAFRKEETPHLPYEEAQERKSRYFDFDMNGWKWLKTDSGIDQSSPSRSGGLRVTERPRKGRLEQEVPMDLVTVIPRRPRLADGILRVDPVLTPGQFLDITFERGSDSEEGFRLDAFLKEEHLVILVVRSQSATGIGQRETARLSLSDQGLPKGTYSVSLFTDPTVFEWTFTIE